jgi:hypothetical protein
MEKEVNIIYVNLAAQSSNEYGGLVASLQIFVGNKDR